MAHVCGALARECHCHLEPGGERARFRAQESAQFMRGRRCTGYRRSQGIAEEQTLFFQLADDAAVGSPSYFLITGGIVRGKVPDVAFFAVLAKIQSLDLLFFFDP